MTRTVSFVAAVLAAGGLTAGPALAAHVPLPPDVRASEIGQPGDMVLGTQATKVQIFATRMGIDSLRMFYEEALKKDGWQLETLPWVAQVKNNLAKVEQTAAQSPEMFQDPAMNQKLQYVRKYAGSYEGQMKLMMYATKGTDRLLLRFVPSENGTEVAAHRWESLMGESQFLAGGSGGGMGISPALAESLGASSFQEPTWPEANPCCGGPGVPDGLRQMPYSVPSYPDARVLTSTSFPGMEQFGAKMEIYATRDPVDSVVQFYRTSMPEYGWEVDRTPMPAMPAPPRDMPVVRTETLTYQSNQGMCAVVVSETGPMPTESEFYQHLPKDQAGTLPAEVSDMMQGEQTVVAVTYFDQPRPGAKR